MWAKQILVVSTEVKGFCFLQVAVQETCKSVKTLNTFISVIFGDNAVRCLSFISVPIFSLVWVHLCSEET